MLLKGCADSILSGSAKFPAFLATTFHIGLTVELNGSFRADLF